MNARQQQLAGVDTEAKCWALYVDRGLTTRQIAAELGIASSTVSRALRRAEKRAQGAMDASIVAHKAQAYQRLERLWRLAMTAYTASIGERTRKRSRRRTGGEGGFDETEIATEAIPGNPRWLAEARGALADIRRLMGLDAPVRVQEVPPDRPFEGLTDDDLHRELVETLRAAGIDPRALALPPAGDTIN